MRCKSISGTSFEDRSRAENRGEEFLEKRRTYNRLYMRAWRADPRRRTHELHSRQRWDYQRKLRSVHREPRPFTDNSGVPVCGFCRKDPPVRDVMRLRISADAAARFVPVRVPYCGHC